MTKQRKPNPDQSALFRKKAREIGCDGEEARFDAALRKLVPPVEAKEPEGEASKKGRE